ncbi:MULTISPECIES: winged helix-turn-helix transcriptional regulator [unclassified Streptomyces]|uniref:winged helix-turn-helix transcriptional regulator n=1 Tax=unclassified Streptomyces TaxID=2593676 RepID=UPI0036EB9930
MGHPRVRQSADQGCGRPAGFRVARGATGGEHHSGRAGRADGVDDVAHVGLAVREPLHGPHRFTQLCDALPGISPHTLTSRLRQFERHGIVTRTTFAEIPPRVEYALTPLGEGLRDVLEATGTWAMAVPDPAAEVTA